MPGDLSRAFYLSPERASGLADLLSGLGDSVLNQRRVLLRLGFALHFGVGIHFGRQRSLELAAFVTDTIDYTLFESG